MKATGIVLITLVCIVNAQEGQVCGIAGTCTFEKKPCSVGYDCGNPQETDCGFVYTCVPNGETPGPTKSPTRFLPEDESTGSPTGTPTGSPTGTPTISPTGAPTGSPTGSPSVLPTSAPTMPPSVTSRPTYKNIHHSEARGNPDSLINVFILAMLMFVALVIVGCIMLKK